MRALSLLTVVSLALVTGCAVTNDGGDADEIASRSDPLTLIPTLPILKPRARFICRAGSTLPYCQGIVGAGFGSGPVDSHLGRGWNDITDFDVPSHFSCLDPISIADPGLTAPTVSSKFHFASSTETLFQSLSLDGRVSGSDPTGSVPIAASIGGTMVQTATAHRNTINIVLHSKVTFGEKRISVTPRMTAGALERFDGSGARAFRDLCGDRFVESVTPGGEFFAVVQISSSSANVQNELKARLSAALGSGDNADTSLQKIVNATNLGDGVPINIGGTSTTISDVGTVEVRIETLQRGGSVLTVPQTIGELKSRFASFPASITDSGHTVVMGVRTTSYRVLPTFGTRVPFSMTDASSSVNRVLAPRYLQWLDIYNEATYALANPSRYFNFSEATVTTLQQTATDALTVIEDLVDTCGTGSSCVESSVRSTVPDPSTSRSRLPVRKQRYVIGADAFRLAAASAGALSTSNREWGNGSCIIDKDTSPPLPPAGHFRVWTSRGLSFPDTRCHYKLFNRGRLVSPWQVESIDFDAKLSENQVIEHVSTASDLTFEFEQVSPFISVAPDTSAIFNTITLVGPVSDGGEPWRSAITTR